MGDLSRAWKYSAKIYRDFYNLTMTQAKKWKGRYYKSQKENQRLREENAEKEACIQEDFHTLKGLENTLEEQGKTIERLRGLLAEIDNIANEGMQATYNLASFNASQISRIKYLLLEKELSDEKS